MVRSVRRVLLTSLLLFFLGFCLRAGIVIVGKLYLTIDSAEMTSAAETLARTGTLGNPFGGDTGPTAHMGPLYPFLLSLIYRAAGSMENGELPKELFSCAISAILYALLPWLAFTLELPVADGVLAGLIGECIPLALWIETKGTWDTALTGLFLVVLLGWTAWIWRKSLFPSWSYGFTWGAAMLTCPTLLSALLVWLAVLFVGAGWKRPRLAVLKVLAGVALITAPWIARNYVELGTISWLRDNLGLELSVSNNDDAEPRLEQNVNTRFFKDNHPHNNPIVMARIREIGEPAYSREQGERAANWIRSHPARFFQLTATRIWLTWFPVRAHWLDTGFEALLTIGGGVGFWLLGRNRYVLFLVGSLFLAFPLVYYLVESDMRYRFPVRFVLLLMCAVALLRFMPFLKPPLAWFETQPEKRLRHTPTTEQNPVATAKSDLPIAR